MAGSEVTFSIGGDDTDTTFSGAIVDTVGGGGTTAITKVGTGELTLDGTLSYTGLTTITDGTLDVNTALGTGANVVNADGGTTNFGESQTLAALNIGAGAVVALVTPPPAPATDELTATTHPQRWLLLVHRWSPNPVHCACCCSAR
jgi:autotransporter-associated beta strand protein